MASSSAAPPEPTWDGGSESDVVVLPFGSSSSPAATSSSASSSPRTSGGSGTGGAGGGGGGAGAGRHPSTLRAAAAAAGRASVLLGTTAGATASATAAPPDAAGTGTGAPTGAYPPALGISFALLLLLFLLTTAGVASAFRTGGGDGTAAAGTAGPFSRRGRGAAGRQRDDGRRGGRADRKEASSSSGGVPTVTAALSTLSSFGMDAARAAGSAVERNRRAYWDDLAPPFGIEMREKGGGGGSGRRKRGGGRTRRTMGRRTTSDGSNLSGRSGAADGDDAAGDTATTGNASSCRSLATGTLLLERGGGGLRSDDDDVSSSSSVCTYDDDDSEGSYDSDCSDYSDSWAFGAAEGLGLLEAASGGAAADAAAKNPPASSVGAAKGRPSSRPSSSRGSTTRTRTVTHFCFLVHGHRGYSRDLGYLKSALEGSATRALMMSDEAEVKEGGEEEGKGRDEPRGRSGEGGARTTSRRGPWRRQRRQQQQKGRRQRLVDASPAGGTSDKTVQGRSLGVGTYHRASSYGSLDGATHDVSAAATTTADDGDDDDGGMSSSPSAPSPPPMPPPSVRHEFCVHSAVCNEGRTKDGVRAGGERLVQEMLDVMREEVARKRRRRRNRRRRRRGDDERGQVVDVTLSMVGNSLGGIYSRYAIARLAELASTERSDGSDDGGGGGSSGGDAAGRNEDGTGSSSIGPLLIDLGDGLGTTLRVHLNVFCTTATPHLGCSGHTYVPIPRTAEVAVGHALGETGRDLFRINDLLKTMSTTSRYLRPLGSFRRRVAYANAYHTDFPVPAATAAFLHEESTYPHHFWEDESTHETSGDPELDRYIVATLRTEPSSHHHHRSVGGLDSDGSGDGDGDGNGNGNGPASDDVSSEDTDQGLQDDLAQMSTALDSLGWKKVIVDLRGEIPIGVSVPRVPGVMRKRSHSGGGGDGAGSGSLTSSARSRTASTRSLSGGLVGRGVLASADDDGGHGVGGSLEVEEEYYRQEIVEEQDLEIEELLVGEAGGTLTSSSALHVESLRRRSVIESRHAKMAFASPRDGSIRLPVGHNMICAFSRGRISSLMNKGGRPVMDNLAKELVGDILTWEPCDSE